MIIMQQNLYYQTEFWERKN